MSNSKKIFFIAPSLGMGGMERASANTVNGLINAGYDVVFLSLFKKEHFFKLESSVKVLEPDGFNITNLSLLRSVLWIRKEVKKNKPDFVLVFNKFYGAITAFALLKTQYRYSVSERSSPFYKWHFPLNIINKIAYLLNPPKGVIAQTQLASEYQRKYFRNSTIKVIPNIVREIKLYPEIKREKVILAVGRLNDYLKGFDLLIESFALLKNQDWELHFAGGDENGEYLKNQAKHLGIRERVKFLGKVKDIDRCYAYAGIYVIPSRSEGFPNALAEAMAAGCCCIAFDFDAGPRDIIINNVNGVIVPENNVVKMAENIDALILDKPLRQRLGFNAFEIKNKLHSRAITSQIIDFITNE